MYRVLLAAVSLFALSVTCKAADNITPLPEKIIQVTVDEKGLAYMGRDTLTLIELTEELHLRLWKSYLGTGKMPTKILVTYTGKVTPANEAATDKAIQDAQQKTLKEYCVHKYKKRYEDISSSQQKKLKKQFPVLFQQFFNAASAN